MCRFHPCRDGKYVKIYAGEAAGEGLETTRHAASLDKGVPGVLHGNRNFLLQDADGQITEAHTITAGLDYPAIGPEHAWLPDVGRASYFSAHAQEAMIGRARWRDSGWKDCESGVVAVVSKKKK